MLTPIRSMVAVSLGLILPAALISCTSETDNPTYHDQIAPSSTGASGSDAIAPSTPGGPIRNQNNDSEPTAPPSGHDRPQTTNRWYV
ncbi:MAG: hypothetical protein ACM359_22495 [Bacillota bacterium]